MLKFLGGTKESISLPKCKTLTEVYKAVFEADIKMEYILPKDDHGDDERRSAHGK